MLRKEILYTLAFLAYALASSNALPYFDDPAMKQLMYQPISLTGLMIAVFALSTAYFFSIAAYVLLVSHIAWNPSLSAKEVLMAGLSYIVIYPAAMSAVMVAGPFIAWATNAGGLVIVLGVLALVMNVAYIIFIIPYTVLDKVPSRFGYLTPGGGRTVAAGLMAFVAYLLTSAAVNYPISLIAGRRYMYLYLLSWNPGRSSASLPGVWSWGDVAGVVVMATIYRLLSGRWVVEATRPAPQAG